jgi:hypothetical protein
MASRWNDRSPLSVMILVRDAVHRGKVAIDGPPSGR